jgi:hypothetical protein
MANTFGTKIVAEATSEGEVIARITVEHFKLDYAGLVKVESSVQEMLDTQFSWGVEQVEAMKAAK